MKKLSKKIQISYSAIKDFDNCSRLYYFTNIYRNPKTGNRVQIVNPYISLGSAVHDAIDELLDLAPSKRINASLTRRLEKIWEKYEGKKGGFISRKQELEFKKRGIKMLKKVEGSEMLSRRSLKREKELPRMPLSEDIDLVGSFDWIEVLPDNSLHIIDFKTGRGRENKKSLQLPIYYILAKNNYSQKVKKLSYWYLEDKSEPTSKEIGEINNSLSEIKDKADEIKKAIERSEFLCNSHYPRCFWCRKYESIISGRAEFISTDERGKDLYYITNGEEVIRKINDEDFLNDKEKKILQIRMNNGDIKEILKMSQKETEKIVLNIKEKIKDNLSSKELKAFIKELSKSNI